MRIEWIEQRLENWALWMARGEGGGLGFAKACIFADGPSARGVAVEAVIPVNELEASETNTAVESLKLGHGHLYQTLYLFYVRGLGVKGTAERMRRAVSTIHAQLGQADLLLVAWFNDRRSRTPRPWRADASRIPPAPVLSLAWAAPPKGKRGPARPAKTKPAPAPAPAVQPEQQPVRRRRPTLTLKRKEAQDGQGD